MEQPKAGMALHRGLIRPSEKSQGLKSVRDASAKLAELRRAQAAQNEADREAFNRAWGKHPDGDG